MASLSVKKEGRKEGKKGGRKEFVEGRVLYSDPLKVLEMNQLSHPGTPHSISLIVPVTLTSLVKHV